MNARAIITVGALLILAHPVAAQTMARLKEESPGLLAKAKVTPDSALKVALARVPGAKLKAREIEEEHGKLVYSFDLMIPGKSGIEEVQVDALTGAVVGVEHEDAASEAREAQEDKAKPKPAPAVKP